MENDLIDDPQLREKLGLDDLQYKTGSAPLILPSKKNVKDPNLKPVSFMEPQTTAQERKLSKSKERKLRSLKENEIKKARRTELYKSLAEHELSEDQRKLMIGSGALGHKMSAKEAVTRQLREEQAGISVLSEKLSNMSKRSRLHQEKELDESESDDDLSMSEDEMKISNITSKCSTEPKKNTESVSISTKDSVGIKNVPRKVKGFFDDVPEISKPTQPLVSSNSSTLKASVLKSSLKKASSPSVSKTVRIGGVIGSDAPKSKIVVAPAVTSLPQKKVLPSSDLSSSSESSSSDSDDNGDSKKPGDAKFSHLANFLTSIGKGNLIKAKSSKKEVSDSDSDSDSDSESSSDTAESSSDESSSDTARKQVMKKLASRPAKAPQNVSEPSPFSFSISLSKAGKVELPLDTPLDNNKPKESVEEVEKLDLVAESIRASPFHNGGAPAGGGSSDPFKRLEQLRERNKALASSGRTAALLLPRSLGGVGFEEEDVRESDLSGALMLAERREAHQRALIDGVEAEFLQEQRDRFRLTAQQQVLEAQAAAGIAPSARAFLQTLSAEQLAVRRAEQALDPRLRMWALDGSHVIASSEEHQLDAGAFSAYGSRAQMPRRPADIAKSRLGLPVVQMEQEIMEKIHRHDVVILCGETGSGKTTQVPQFLYEAGYGLPVSAVVRNGLEKLAKRVQVRQLEISSSVADEEVDEADRKQMLLKQEEELGGIQQESVEAAADSEDVLRKSSSYDSYAALEELPSGEGEKKKGTRVELERFYRGFPGMIAVTQPRRVAATSTASRVARELGFEPGSRSSHVGHQVRFDSSSVTPQTRLKFMTDGVLLREISEDLLLRKYSVIVLDEAHERNVNTDVLIGMLSRAVPLRNAIAQQQADALRKRAAADPLFVPPAPGHPDAPLGPLKLIIMSATLRVSDFTENKRLFANPPPVVKVEARQFPVNPHFSKETVLDDYVGAAFTKVVKIHERLPDGGILVFLTGQEEIEQLCAKLNARFARKRRPRLVGDGTAAPSLNVDTDQMKTKEDADGDITDASISDDELSEEDFEEEDSKDEETAGSSIETKKIRVDENTQEKTDSADDNEMKFDFGTSASDALPLTASDSSIKKKKGPDFADSDSESDSESQKSSASEKDDDMEHQDIEEKSNSDGPKHTEQEKKVVVLPLYAMLPLAQQAKVFQSYPPGTRVIVVATNVAETSITIPGMRYVIDPGRVKRKVYDLRTGASRFEIGWISRASADQRAGRAGRTGPGHAYRLYSPAVYADTFVPFDEPEVCTMPIDGLVLQLKLLGIDCLATFPFPSPPPPASLLAAIRSLTNLGALRPALRSAEDKLRVQLEDPSLFESGDATGRSVSANNDRNSQKISLEETHASGISSLADVASEVLTPLGRKMARLPLHPSLAKLLVLARQIDANLNDRLRAAGTVSTQNENELHYANKNLDGSVRLEAYARLLAACLTVPNVFVTPSLAPPGTGLNAASTNHKNEDGDDEFEGDPDIEVIDAQDAKDLVDSDYDPEDDTSAKPKELERGLEVETVEQQVERERQEQRLARARARRLELRNAAQAAHARMRHPLSDALTLLRAAGSYAYVHASKGPAAAAAFAKSQWLRPKAMKEILQLEGQLRRMLYQNDAGERQTHRRRDGSTNSTKSASTAEEMEDLILAVEKASNDQFEASSVTENDAEPVSAGTKRHRAAEDHENINNGESALERVLPPPSSQVEFSLRQLITAGYIDRIARRAPPEMVAAAAAAGQMGKGRAWIPYIPSASYLDSFRANSISSNGTSAEVNAPLRDLVYIHPTSALDSVDPTVMPTFVVFTEVAVAGRKSRAFMRGVTAVDEASLHSVAAGSPMVKLGPILDVPAPHYSPVLDAVVCSRVPFVSERAWKLAPVTTRLLAEDPTQVGGVYEASSNDSARENMRLQELALRAFGRALLEGHVVQGLKPFSSVLAAPAAVLSKGTPQPRALLLLEALSHPPKGALIQLPDDTKVTVTRVASASELRAAWSSSPGYLLSELGAWVQKDHVSSLAKLWPRIVAVFLSNKMEDTVSKKKKVNV